MNAKRPCARCGQECDEAQRNTDGTYLHDGCAAAETQEQGWSQPGSLLGSRSQKEEAKK